MTFHKLAGFLALIGLLSVQPTTVLAGEDNRGFFGHVRGRL